MLKKSIALLFVVIFAFSSFATGLNTQALSGSSVSTDTVSKDELSSQNRAAAPSSSENYRIGSFSQYMKENAARVSPEDIINVDLNSFSVEEGMVASKTDSISGTGKPAVICGDIGKITFKFNSLQEGLYSIILKYHPVEGKGANIERSLYLNGEMPFEEARNLSFNRLWKNDGEKIFSKSGNEYRRRQIEIMDFVEVALSSSSSYENAVLKFLVKKGENTLTFESVAEPVAIAGITLKNTVKPSYAKVSEDDKAKGYTSIDAGKDIIFVQAEDSTVKSSPTLYGIEDRTSPANVPYSSSVILLNTIGGYNWRYQGQWIEWDLKVPESGLYKVAFRCKQDYKSGSFVTRKLMVDGKIPFTEAENIKINYNLNWQNIVLGEKSPQLVYLSKGAHTIRMEVAIGELGKILGKVEKSILDLNEVYRNILMITGSFPDQLRDYKLEKNIPDLFTTLKSQIAILNSCNNELNAISSNKGEENAMIQQLIYLIQSFIDKPDTIPERITKLNDMLSTMATWILLASEQPLAIDYLMIAPPDKELPAADVMWYRKIYYEIKEFFMSFFENYNYVDDLSADGNKNAGETTLWLAGNAGRDQATVIKMLSDNFFTREKNIKLNLRLVDMGILLRAVSANKGPDVAIFQNQATPLNYGLRSALYDLNRFSDIKEIEARFLPSATEPFRLGEKLYGLPEQQVFPMMFYRKDILSNLKISPPQTWEDLYEIIPTLQKNHLDIGLPTPVAIQSGGEATSLNAVYAMFLLQGGSGLFNKDNSRCILNDNKAIDAFKNWTELYTKYKVPKQINELNRFRTGESPIVIAPYTFYNSLVVAAPEIKGLWDLVPIPGTKDESGVVHREASSTVSAAIMFENAKDKNASWEFMKWWTAKETQILYGREMETLQGLSARWPTANLEAMGLLSWPTKTYIQLSEQRKWTIGIPEVPGGYFVGRHVDNAAKAVINDGANPRETLIDYVDTINEEIITKRKEFGME